MPPAGLSSDLKGLTIVNQGQLTLHYHSYNEISSAASQSTTVSRKRTLDRVDDEEYSEALASLMEFDLSPQSRPSLTTTTKRPRLEEPCIKMVELEVDKPQKIDKLEMIDKPEMIEKPQKIDNPEKKVKQEERQPAQDEPKKKGSLCKNCGNAFDDIQNEVSRRPCKYHPGMSTTGSSTSHLSKLGDKNVGSTILTMIITSRILPKVPRWSEVDTIKSRG